MEDFPKWLLRIVGVIGVIAFITTYWIRHDWTQGWAPRFNSEDFSPPPRNPSQASAPASAPAAEPAATAETARPAAEAPRAAAAATAAGARAYAPCQPIGRTAKGELVYSMDCRSPPQP